GGAARAFLEIGLTAEHLHAGLAEWNDQLRRAWVITHRLPVMPAFGGRAGRHPFLRALLHNVIPIVHLAGLAVDVVEDILVDGLFHIEELTRLTVELP